MFQPGDRVRVEGESVALFGRMGTVVRDSVAGISVHLDASRSTSDYVPYGGEYVFRESQLVRRVRIRPLVPPRV